jgi:hypothetical protein
MVELMAWELAEGLWGCFGGKKWKGLSTSPNTVWLPLGFPSSQTPFRFFLAEPMPMVLPCFLPLGEIRCLEQP